MWQTSQSNKPPNALDCLLGGEKANHWTVAGDSEIPKTDAAAKGSTEAKEASYRLQAQHLATTQTAYSQDPPVRKAGQVLAEQWLRLSGPSIIPKERGL